MRKFIFTLFIVVAIVAAPGGSVFAGKVDGVSLNAQGTVDAFNNMNGGDGFQFTTTPDYPGMGAENHPGYLWTLNNSGTDAPGAGAYNNNTIQSIITTAYVTDYLDGTVDWGGKLYYANGVTGVVKFVDTPTGELGPNWSTPMSVGTAYLYKTFATGGIDFSTAGYSPDDFINKMYEFSFSGSGGLENILLGINPDMDYWLSDYDPDAYYDEIGYYSVFGMDAVGVRRSTGNGGYKDKSGGLFYIAAADSQVTPEPATMMLLGTGLLALPVARRFMTNRQKN